MLLSKDGATKTSQMLLGNIFVWFWDKISHNLQNKIFSKMALSKDGATKIIQILLGQVKRIHE